MDQRDQPPDYLLIGHVAHDETPQGPKLGGTVSYTGSTVNALGAHVAIVTSAHSDEVVLGQLSAQVDVHLVTAPYSTVFVNTYEGDVRRQVLRHRAALLSLHDVPDQWRSAGIVHLGPLADEVDPDLATAFPGALVAATPQGWMRAWDAEGVVFPKKWERAEQLLPLLSAVIFSEEDIHLDKQLEAHYASLAQVLVVTRAARGCTVYQQGEAPFDVPSPQLPLVDATGAGDIFAGIFLLIWQRTGAIQRAAEVATRLASISITRTGLSGIPTGEEIAEALA
jgi:sugar/nucleoside kinase (ribokinase family)